ncbi:uncharacterized protein LOC111044202 [Nilaparvata lugens]|uniref:uncharacterized protein LOC111044202 n=1 Tax=Nilaparvata lugens TaxID=108931 RepID=UPI000B9945D5|nr:uncharacterized protein LOC111044202 [Nilaparvata lugens]
MISDQLTIINEYKTNHESLMTENSNLKKKCNDLETRLEDLEQYSRANSIEINGIPEDKNEDIIQIVKNVGHGLGVPVQEQDIVACHRLGSPNKDGVRTREIIVKFVRRLVKENLLQQRRVKRNFNTRDIGIMDRTTEAVYINESLSVARRKIFNELKIMKKDNLLQYVWVRNGKVLTRAHDGAKVVAVTTLDQVSALKLKNTGKQLSPSKQNQLIQITNPRSK